MGLEALTLAELEARIARLVVADGDLAVRYLTEHSERLAVQRGVVLPVSRQSQTGVMLTVRWRSGIGYAATADLSSDGLRAALALAHDWAKASDRSGLFERVLLPAPDPRSTNDGEAKVGNVNVGANVGLNVGANVGANTLAVGRSRAQRQSVDPAPKRWSGADRRQLLDLLRAESTMLKRDARIVNWTAGARLTTCMQVNFWNGRLLAERHLQLAETSLDATAQHDGRVQSRSTGGQYNGVCRQFHTLDDIVPTFSGQGACIAREAIELLQAPNCPSRNLSLVLAPDQMMLQIHESIGHPLELDRILGDERNFAGTSFVSLDMFGRYQYGSPLLNVSFDPTLEGELATCEADDDGTRTSRQMLIRNGRLERPLGSPLSIARAAAQGALLEGVANARASGWYRPTMDRMGNINVEPGESTFESMIAGVERGVFMRTNASWSIDDSRNKFQFGCEWGQLIENGQLTRVVRNPNYRGVSASFWRSLSAVGNEATRELHGTPFCGKGEPGQVIRVGHAAPVCVFDSVDVFGAQD